MDLKLMTSNSFQDILIIGYGNTLRSDDGIGRYIAESFPSQVGLKVLSVHQLTPELAVDIAEAKAVIFIDVILTEEKRVKLQALHPSDSQTILGHSLNPQSLLALTEMLYEGVPRAWWLLIPGDNFSFGETFSELTQSQIPIAIKRLNDLIQTLQKSGS